MIYPNVRIPGSRPFRPPSQKEKPVREQSWDNRFHLGKIPEYNAMQDRHIDPGKFRKTRKKIVLLPERAIKKIKKPSVPDLAKCVSVKGFAKPPVVPNQIVNKLTSNLVSAWNLKSIPQSQREVFLQAISKLPAKEKSSALVKEVESLKTDKNQTQNALRAVKKREEFIKELLDFAKTIDVPTNSIKHSCVESLMNLRSLSLQVVETVELWKKRMAEFDPDIGVVEFVWEEGNYLVKMQNDIRVLNTTPIGTFIDLLENDPFLIHVRKDGHRIELPIDGNTLKKVREAEEVLKASGMGEVIQPQVPDTPRRLNECRSSRLFHKEEAKQLTLEPIQGDIEEQILQYSLLVPESMQESMGKPENAFTNALNMRFPAFLWARIGNENVGLVTLNLENQKSMHKRLYISHFSVLQHDMIEKLLELLIVYVWKNYDCIEIRIGIISKITEQGKYEADKSIKQFFDKAGFRWKQMIYTVNEIPVQLLGLRRSDTSGCERTGFSIFDDCIEMAYACTIQTDETTESKEAELDYCSIVGVSCAIKALGGSSLTEFQSLISKMLGIPPAFRFRKDIKLENAMKDLNSVKLTASGLNDGLETSVSCSALGLSWPKYLPSTFQNHSYTKIISQVTIMKSSTFTIYIVSTEDPQYSVFFIPTENRPGLFNFVKTLLKGIEKIGESEEIWIPSFCVERENSVNGVIGSSIDGKKHITACVESFRFKVHSALHPIGSFLPKFQELSIISQSQLGKESGLIIKTEFVFGMIHHKLDEDLEVPLFVVHVPADKFL